MHLTKSLFVDYLDYPKLARWKVNDSVIYKKIRKLENIEAEEHIIQIGQAVENAVKDFLQQKYTTDIVDLMPQYKQIVIQDEDEEKDDYELLVHANANLPIALKNTIDAIKQQTKVLYQPTFKISDCLVRADFMVRNGDEYDLIEVKAKSGIRKKVKDDGEDKRIGPIEDKFINDVSFQKYVINQVLAQEGLPLLGKIYIAYLNRDYIKQGALNLVELIKEDLADKQTEIEIVQRNKPTKMLINDLLLDNQTIEKKLQEMRNYLTLSQEEFNKIFLWQGTKYLEYFGEDKPFGTVMGMGIHHSNALYIQDLYYQGRHKISDLTEDEIDGFNEAGQKFIRRYLRCKESGPIIDSDAIRTTFSEFQFPICFYDYETISVPVPFLDNTRPYLQTVVQYSLHKYYEDGTMKHYGGVFVGEGEHAVKQLDIPRNPNLVEEEYDRYITGSYKDLLVQMIADIGEDLHKSTFVVRYEPFEKTRNKEIAQLFPDLADAYLQINENTCDLMKVVSLGSYFNTDCKGSASIKKVLPVLVPGMDYTTLDIGRGDIAMNKLFQLIHGDLPVSEKDKVIEDLLIYCGQDTLAMVRIYEAIKKII